MNVENFIKVPEPQQEVKRMIQDESCILKEIENLPPKIKHNVFMQEDDKEQGKVIVANAFNKKKTEVKKESDNLQSTLFFFSDYLRLIL